MPHAQIRTSHGLGPEGRFVVVELGDGTSTFVSVQPLNVQVASETFVYSYFQGADQATDLAGVLRQPLPLGLVMLPGWRIRTNTTALEAGDNSGGPALYVRETPQRGLAVGQDALLSAVRRLIGEEALRGWHHRYRLLVRRGGVRLGGRGLNGTRAP